MLGLAQRDPALALPHVQAALRGERAMPMVFEAAALVASPTLVDDLRQFDTASDEPFFDGLVQAALRACESGVPAEWL